MQVFSSGITNSSLCVDNKPRNSFFKLFLISDFKYLVVTDESILVHWQFVISRHLISYAVLSSRQTLRFSENKYFITLNWKFKIVPGLRKLLNLKILSGPIGQCKLFLMGWLFKVWVGRLIYGNKAHSLVNIKMLFLWIYQVECN